MRYDVQVRCLNPHHAQGFCKLHYQRFRKHGDIKARVVRKGGSSKHPLYSVYNNMLARCNNPNSENYKYYGARGIKVCSLWAGYNGFQHFIRDMGPRPRGFQLDRKEVNHDYSPANCRWVNKYVQMGNTRATRKVAGVNWNARLKKWRARIKVKGKELALGHYPTFDEAVKVRRSAELIYV